MEQLDVIVIGAGPAGLAAGINSASYDLNTLIIEQKIPGGCAAEIPFLENYPGYVERITGSELISNMVRQCERSGADIKQLESAVELCFDDDRRVVRTDKSSYESKAVIIATGRSCKLLGVPGEEEYRGRGVSYCAVCDGHFFKEKRVVVVGSDSRATEVATYLSGLASDVFLLCPEEEICAEKILLIYMESERVNVLKKAELIEIKGDVNVGSVIIADSDTGETREIYTDGVFFQLEDIPNSNIAKNAGIAVDDNDYIIVNNHGRTNIDGVYAIGDVTTSPIKMVVTAAAQAAIATMDMLGYISESM